MFSKNNEILPKKSREYFDNPINYDKRGYIFSPKYRDPIDLLKSPISQVRSVLCKCPSIGDVSTNGLPDSIMFKSPKVTQIGYKEAS